MTQLYVQESGQYYQASDEVVIRCAQCAMAKRFRVGSPVLTSPARTREFLRLRLGHLPFETFGVILLDNRHRLIAVEDLFRGTIDGAAVYPRELLRHVLMQGAAAVVLYHNHPSQMSSPSAADELITSKLREALSLIEVRLLDHLIVGADIYSFAEHGLL